MTLIQRYADSFVRLFYPLLCKGCGAEVFKKETLLCWRCLQALPLTGFEAHEENPVKRIFTGRIPVREAMAALYFHQDSITQTLVHRIKYQSETGLGSFMGAFMGELLATQERYRQVDVVIPLPLNEKKHRQRGFNQAALLAAGIAEILRKPLDTTTLIRVKATSTQTRKNRMERWQNVDQVFSLQPSHQLQNKHVLMVDDVITTGATLEAAGRALLQVPGLTLSVCSLAAASQL